MSGEASYDAMLAALGPPAESKRPDEFTNEDAARHWKTSECTARRRLNAMVAAGRLVARDIAVNGKRVKCFRQS